VDPVKLRAVARPTMQDQQHRVVASSLIWIHCSIPTIRTNRCWVHIAAPRKWSAATADESDDDLSAGVNGPCAELFSGIRWMAAVRVASSTGSVFGSHSVRPAR
jgi:hypothetical protein